MSNNPTLPPNNNPTITPIPSVLLDHWMPQLKDTELRVLLIVARQTLGRSGKDTDWLSHSQLKARTGRASEAVSAAVDALIRGGLLEVFTHEGNPLSSPRERQVHRGILLYRLAPALLEDIRKAKTEVGKTKTTEYREFNTRYFRFPKSSTEEQPTTEQQPASLQDQEEKRLIEGEKQRIRERLSKITAKNSIATDRSRIHSSYSGRRWR